MRTLFLVLFTSVSSAGPTASAPLVVHEWGTFTTVAGRDGVAMDWRPLASPSDLPSFVYRATDEGLRDVVRERIDKSGVSRVRMETPVLYFYSDVAREVSVKVGFPEGHVTEWYPRALSVDRGIDWGRIRVDPSLAVAFPDDGVPSHYYPARNAAATPVRVCDVHGSEYEKFLFYRGIGDFDLPVRVTLDGSLVDVRQLGGAPLGEVVVFERRGDRLGFTHARVEDGRAAIDRPTLDDDVDGVVASLEAMLIRRGLYADEARAMTDTWRDSWFEDGLRVLYLLSSDDVERVLPLEVSPAPDELVRVLVGRVEVITPESTLAVRATLDAAFSELDGTGTIDALELDHGRFAEPVLQRALDSASDPDEIAHLRSVLDAIAARGGTETDATPR